MRHYSDAVSGLVGKSTKKLMTTTALTAAGLLAIGTPAKADNAWVLNQVGGSFDTDISQPNTTNITQNTARAIGEGNLDIGSHQTVRINQQSSSSLFVARDNRADPTQILGKLNANGRVMVIDQNGVFFGKDAVVDVAGVVATTGTVSNTDIMSGNETNITNFSKADITNNGVIMSKNEVALLTGGNVTNNGEITSISGNVLLASVTQVTNLDSLIEKGADKATIEMALSKSGKIINNGLVSAGNAGLAAFVGPQIQNNGIINAKMGTVAMGAGEKVTLDFYGDGLIEVAVEGEAENALIENKGTIRAEGGTVAISASAAKGVVDNVINMDGVVDVSSVSVQGGKIILSGGSKGKVAVKGKLDASGKDKGGDIDVRGQIVEVAETGEVVNTGDNGTTEIIGKDKAIFRGSVTSGTNSFVEISGYALELNGDVTLDEGSRISFDPAVLDVGAGEAATFVSAMNNNNVIVDVEASETINLNADIDTSTQTTNSVLNFKDEDSNNDLTVNLNAKVTLGGNQTLTGDATVTNVAATGSIQNGVDVSTSGGTVNVAAGTFNESVTIDKMLTLNGANAGTAGFAPGRGAETIIKPNSPGILVAAGGSGTVIDGVTIDGGDDGVEIDGADSVTVKNSIIKNSLRDGIHAVGSELSLFENNLIQDVLGNDGIYMHSSHGTKVASNLIRRTNDDGIHVERSEDVVLERNNIRDTAENGIYARDAQKIGMFSNLIRNTGLTTSKDGILVEDSSNIEVAYTNIRNTGNNGITIVNGSDAELYNNNVATVTADGIEVTNNENVIIRSNVIGNSGGPGNVGGEGIDVNGSNGAHILLNAVVNTTLSGISINPSDDVLVERNNIRDVGGFGVEIRGGENAHVESNVIRRTGNSGVLVKENTDSFIYSNRIEDAGNDGIEARASHGVEASHNVIARSTDNGIFFQDSDWSEAQNNMIFDSGDDGIDVNRGNRTSIYENTITRSGGDGVDIVGTDEVFAERNTITHSGDDGIHARDFTTAWISYNDISWTGDDGIEALDGGFVSIYDNYIDLSGFTKNVGFGNTEVGDDANGIYVANITGGKAIPEKALKAGPGVSSYGSAVEIYNNEVANAEDDGVQVKDSASAYIAKNIIGHAGDDGVDVDNVGVTIARDNAISSVLDKGITVDGGRYAGVFDNRILLAGNDGIQVEGVFGGTDAMLLGDVEYGYGWSVNVSGNEIAMTGDDGIEVGYSGPTKIHENKIFMAGMGEGLGEVIDEINSFASLTFVPHFAITAITRPQEPTIDSFDWSWGNGHGINVHGIDGAYYSPNGWAADITGNKVKWTGGHGILAQNNDRTRIEDNKVRYAGIDETTFYGAENMMDVLSSGPFHRSNPGRRDLWQSEGSMISVLKDYFGNDETPEEPTYEDYITIGDVRFDSYDGIHAENIYGQYEEGLSETDYLFDLKITDNTVKVTGDDGIEVVYAGRTLIAGNKVRDAGQGRSEDYGSGDYYGADGIHVRGIYNESDVYYGGGTDGEGFYNYTVNIIGNDVDTTADDGIEVIWSGSTLVDSNRVIHAGVGFGSYYNGGDYFGADGIHVRGVFAQDNGYYGDGYYGPEGFVEYSVVVRNNFVNETADDGIEVVSAGRTLIDNNRVYNAGTNGSATTPEILSTDSRSRRSETDGYGADGVHVRNVVDFGPERSYETDSVGDAGESLSVEITSNTVGQLAIEEMDEPETSEEISARYEKEDRFFINEESYIAGAADDGIQVLFSGNTVTDDNTVANSGVGGGFYYEGDVDQWGSDGIHVLTGYFHKGLPEQGHSYEEGYGRGDSDIKDDGYYYNPYFLKTRVEITNNEVDNSADDGIEAEGVTDLLIDNNNIDESDDDGIKVIGYAGFFSEADSDTEEPSVTFGIDSEPPVFTAEITGNTVDNSGGDGAESNNYDSTTFESNLVSNSEDNGFLASGPFHGDVIVSDNAFLSNRIGAQFESGLIDLTGTGNLFSGGDVGLRFAPFDFATVDEGFFPYWPKFPFPELPESGFADLALVDNDGPGADTLGGVFPPTNFGGTIGAQTFVGQSQFFVELDNEAFFAPGTPTILNGLDSTYFIPGTGFFTPSSTGGILTVDQLNFLESRFQHFPDTGDLGLFFFGFVPLIDQEDIFNIFDPANLGLSGLNVTVTGLPTVPGAPFDPNAITPFAGGDTGEVTPESLNNIETAAGEGDAAPCWGDALNSATAGNVVNYSYGMSFEETIRAASTCGSETF